MNKLLVLTCLAACSGNSSSAPDVGNDDAPAAPLDDAAPTGDAAPAVLPEIAFCRVSDPRNPSAAYVTHNGSDNTVSYTCAQPCPDPASCAFGLVGANGPVLSARGDQIQVLAFVVDGMGGHIAYTPDGDDVVVTHGGVGGTGFYHEFDPALQSISTLKTVSLGWEHGANLFGGGGAGWVTRTDATPSSFHALAARPAAAIKWVKDHFAVGKKLGTVGASFGTIATFGAHVWWGLEPIIDYQMLIGGPPLWDVNVGCGRDHVSAGHCDVDVAPCIGNPFSSYGNDDPSCGPATTNNCRVPTIMAQISTGSEFNDAINYIRNTTACTAAATRDPSLDVDNLASTVGSWTFHGRIDFVANEGAPQPPQSDQGMGEGHAMYVYTAIRSDKGWIDNDGHHHGDAWQKDPALVAATAPVVVAGMGH